MYSTLRSTVRIVWNPINLIHVYNYLTNSTYSIIGIHFKHNICLVRERHLTEAFGFFRQCGTVFYLVRYGAVRFIHLVIPVWGIFITAFSNERLCICIIALISYSYLRYALTHG